MTRITRDNWDTTLVQSTQGRAGTPDGNVYIDRAADAFELLPADEVPLVDLGAGLVPNPMVRADGVELQALYLFMGSERSGNSMNEQNFLPGTAGVFAAAGAWQIINGYTFATDADRKVIRGSGWEELSPAGELRRVYVAPNALNALDPATQCYYMLADSASDADRQSATPVDFDFAGVVDEAIQVFGDPSNGNFDSRQKLLIAIARQFGRSYDESDSVSSGQGELGPFRLPMGLGDLPNEENNYTRADVWGPAQIAPWTGLSYQSFATGQTRTGFTQGDGLYSVIINNSLGATVQEVAAWLDALAEEDTDEDVGVGSYRGRRGPELYSRDTQGRVVTRAGIHIDGLAASQQQLIVQVDDGGTPRTYPFYPDVQYDVGPVFETDPNGWGRALYVLTPNGNAFDTATAVTVDAQGGAPMVFGPGDVVGGRINRAFDYDGNTQDGYVGGEDRDCVVMFEGNGVAGKAIQYFTITRQTVVPVSVQVPVDNNG